MLDYLREGDEPVEWRGKCQDLAINFRQRFTDCMILADYLQPHEFLIEALCLHMYGEYLATRDGKSSVWVLIGMIARLAMRMGYHQPLQPTLTSTPFKVISGLDCTDRTQRRLLLLTTETGRDASAGLGIHQTVRHYGIFPDGLAIHD